MSARSGGHEAERRGWWAMRASQRKREGHEEGRPVYPKDMVGFWDLVQALLGKEPCPGVLSKLHRVRLTNCFLKVFLLDQYRITAQYVQYCWLDFLTAWRIYHTSICHIYILTHLWVKCSSVCVWHLCLNSAGGEEVQEDRRSPWLATVLISCKAEWRFILLLCLWICLLNFWK